jgi:hypothetical protein
MEVFLGQKKSGHCQKNLDHRETKIQINGCCKPNTYTRLLFYVKFKKVKDDFQPPIKFIVTLGDEKTKGAIYCGWFF